MTLAELLKIAEDNKASDVHITVGVPPLMRVHGSMMPIPNEPRLMAEDVEALVKGIMGEFQKRAFAERGEIDFSFGLAGMGRYRVNVFRQRGTTAAVFRLVGSIVQPRLAAQRPHLYPATAELLAELQPGVHHPL